MLSQGRKTGASYNYYDDMSSLQDSKGERMKTSFYGEG